MSISSWLRMWQCHTYSQPKLTIWLVMGGVIACPVCGSMLAKPMVDPIGMAGLSGRTLSGTPNGSLGATGLRATIVSSSGLTRTVSFQPSSLSSGTRMNPSQPTRLMSCTS